MADLEKARRRLIDALRDKSSKYWELMKNWYKRRISKDDFDNKARLLLGEEGIQLHNEFLFAILVKCQSGAEIATCRPGPVLPDHHTTTPGLSEEPGLREKRIKLDTPIVDLTPYGALNDFNYMVPTQTIMCGKDLDRLLLCSHELLLPDLPTMHTRMLLGAWESGLEEATEESARYLMIAVEYFLKNVIAACVSDGTSWRLRSRRFQHSFGKGYNSLTTPTSNEQLAHITTNKALQTEALEAEHMSMMSHEPLSKSITLYSLIDTLQVNGTICIPDHTVCQCIIERILARLWHPNREELLCRQSVEQWQKQLH